MLYYIEQKIQLQFISNSHSKSFYICCAVDIPRNLLAFPKSELVLCFESCYVNDLNILLFYLSAKGGTLFEAITSCYCRILQMLLNLCIFIKELFSMLFYTYNRLNSFTFLYLHFINNLNALLQIVSLTWLLRVSNALFFANQLYHLSHLLNWCMIDFL